MNATVPVRTLHLTNAWHPESGGIRTFYAALLEEAERLGRHMTLVVPGERTDTKALGASTALATLRAPHAPFLDRRYRVIWPHRFATPAATDLWRVVADAQPDLIEVCDKYSLCYIAGLVKRCRGIRPTVVGLSQERLDDALAAHALPRRLAARSADAYLRRVYLRQFDAHIANSAYTAAELRDAATRKGPQRPLLWRLRRRIFVEPLGVDTADFSPVLRSEHVRTALALRAGRSRGARVALFAGRLSAEKGVRLLVPAVQRALANGIDLVLAVAGDGPLAAELAQAGARGLGGRVVMLGHVSRRHDLAELVASADLFVHPNPREPFGIGPLEAMACGTPVVVPASGGVLTYASSRNAWLARPGADGLAAAIAACCSSPEEARRRRDKALNDVHAFSWPTAAARYFARYDVIHRARLAGWPDDESAGDWPPVDAGVDVPHGERGPASQAHAGD